MISFRFLFYNPYSMLYLRGKFGTIIIFSLSMIIFVASTCCSQPGVVCSMQYSISVVLPLESPPMRMVQAGEVQAECLARSCISLREKIQSNPSSRTQVFWVSSSTRIKGYIHSTQFHLMDGERTYCCSFLHRPPVQSVSGTCDPQEGRVENTRACHRYGAPPSLLVLGHALGLLGLKSRL